MQDKPWETESDLEVWTDPITGYPCRMVRNGSGVWCGYVGLPEGHPWAAVDRDSIDVHVHGGLTFGEHATLPDWDPPGDRRFWLGFDCNHYGDLAPKREDLLGLGGVYRDARYVTEQVVNLALQARAAATR
jgi:hypothetical protein